MGGNPSVLRLDVGGAEVLFYISGADPATVDNIDVEVRQADSTRWSATMLTLDAIAAVMRRWESTGEGFGGRFFQCQDLVIVKHQGIPAMTEVIANLLETDQLRYRFVELDH